MPARDSAAFDAMAPLVDAFLGLAETVAALKLPPESELKSRRLRKTLEEESQKQNALALQEVRNAALNSSPSFSSRTQEAQKRAVERKKLEELNVLNMSPDEQKKWEAKQRKRDIRKSTKGKVMMLK